MRIGALELLADGSSGPSRECARVVSIEGVAALRLLDRALAAHGNAITATAFAAWLDEALSVAHAIACDIRRRDVDVMPLGTLVLDAIDAVAAVS